MAQLNTKDPKLGPQDDKRAEAFLEITRYLEKNDDEQNITINGLIDLKLTDIKIWSIIIATCTWEASKTLG